ncbi:MAG TPA: hypothetical protein VK024_01310, partial [Actinomycetaceae bacterium]|nr:hypothetical protein [Actinomycetaceae bacterium]
MEAFVVMMGQPSDVRRRLAAGSTVKHVESLCMGGHVHTDRFDAITVEQLRAAGSTKWSRFPQDVGAFIAEMDFGVPPRVTEVVQRAG